MQLEHVNRHGDRYYIFQGKTKTGKSKYYASKRATSEKGVPADSLPDDFEIFENPSNATVTVRRRKPSRVLPSERELVDRLAVELSDYSCVQTIVEGDRIVVYTPDRDPVAVEGVFSRIFGSNTPFGTRDCIRKYTNYTAVMRFTLQNADKRTYSPQRYCFRGSIDGWISIGRSGPLEKLARGLLPHLSEESFYDLI